MLIDDREVRNQRITRRLKVWTMRRSTRRVPVERVRDLLEDTPRAHIAFCRDDTVEAVPVAFHHESGRYWFGLLPASGPAPRDGDVLKLLVDDGRWFFELRGFWIRGHVRVAEHVPDGRSQALAWFELAAEKVVAWNYGTLRTEAGGVA